MNSGPAWGSEGNQVPEDLRTQGLGIWGPRVLMAVLHLAVGDRFATGSNLCQYVIRNTSVGNTHFYTHKRC